MAAGNKLNQFIQNAMNGAHNLGTDTLMACLTNTAPVATNTVYANIVELANGAGYTTGGVAISSVTSAQIAGLYKLIGSLASPTWTATGSMGPFRYVVIYDATPTSPLKPLIAWWDNGSSLTLASGQSFTFALDPTNGFLQAA